MGEVINEYKISVGKPEGKRLEDVDLIHLAEERDWWRGSCEHGNEHSGSIRDGGFLD
jgi:hypothetical protein